MKKSIWIFLFAVLLPGIVLGWLALRSAEEQQIIFERRTAELYQKETEALAAGARDAVEAERRAFGDTVHRLLARSDAEALARDFTNTLMDSWPRKAVGFVLGPDGTMLSPTTSMAAKNGELRTFLWNNGSFLCSTQPAVVYPVPLENNAKAYAYGQQVAKGRGNAQQQQQEGKPALSMWDGSQRTVLAQKGAEQAANASQVLKVPLPDAEPMDKAKLARGTGTPAADAQLRREESKQEGLTATKESSALQLPEQVAPRFAKETPPPMQEPAKAAAAKKDANDSVGMIAGGAAAPQAAAPAPTAARAPAAPALTAAPKPASASKPLKLSGETASAAGVGRSKETMSQRTTPIAAGLSLDQMPAEAAETAKAQSAAQPTTEVNSSPADSAPRQRVIVQEAQIGDAQQQQSQFDPASLASNSQQVANFNSRGNADAYNRMVEPQQQFRSVASNWSAILPSTSDFRALTAGNEEGMLARFVQDKLDLIFWIRPPEAPEMVFGCLVEAADMGPLWANLFTNHVSESRPERPPFVLALLDDRAKPVATFPANMNGRDWKRPFVANEIGEVLPHWEAALYLATPTAVADTARGLRRTISFTIAGAIALIALGGWLVVADVKRQLALAQQKTDFVSNVSHELKTPLTSIRMFAELMHDRPPPAEKQEQYLRIIQVEAERLTRLINNVLDFAKLERRQRRFEKRHLDLCNVITRVWEGQEMHLRDAGFKTNWESSPGPYPVLGDEDALAQILVNLLSNAEKYSSERKEIELVTWTEDGVINMSVLDRGMGVPDGEEKKIFEAFYRAHDSLSSGIQGSGLGLTLAQRLASEQGGEIIFERRPDGGSRFTLRMPLVHDRHSEHLDATTA